LLFHFHFHVRFHFLLHSHSHSLSHSLSHFHSLQLLIIQTLWFKLHDSNEDIISSKFHISNERFKFQTWKSINPRSHICCFVSPITWYSEIICEVYEVYEYLSSYFDRQIWNNIDQSCRKLIVIQSYWGILNNHNEYVECIEWMEW
jgi:hypothetical protein